MPPVGQAHRLAVAQALLKEVQILILGEPKEGLDGPTERALMGTQHRPMTGRSVLPITHRPEGPDLMGLVLILDQSRIRGVDSRTHRA